MIRKLTLAVLVLAPVLALAAPKDVAKGAAKAAAAPAGNAEATDADASSREGDTLATEPMEGGAREGEAAGGAVPPPDTYTVRAGDTLWDLSGRFLNNPWYWPKIWSYNPGITNPHWIYPGNLLRFYQSGEEGPGEVAQVSPEAADDEQEAEPVRELEDLSRVDMARGPSDEEKDAVAVAGPYKIGYVAPRTSFASHDAFVTPRELEESGSIRAAFEERTMLASRDRAYATFRSKGAVKVGETYAIYRTIRAVKHPVTGDMIGYQSVILGSAKVVAMDDKAATIAIASSYEPIERGDLLGPWTQKPYRAVPPKPNGKSLHGFIVTSPVEILTQLAEHHMVFVDKGKVDGVEEGNRFVVVRAGDPRDAKTAIPKWDGSLPTEDVGTLLVVDVKDHASAALVTRSLSELAPGDRVEMRVAGQ
jgi:hypothetical protein